MKLVPKDEVNRFFSVFSLYTEDDIDYQVRTWIKEYGRLAVALSLTRWTLGGSLSKCLYLVLLCVLIVVLL